MWVPNVFSMGIFIKKVLKTPIFEKVFFYQIVIIIFFFMDYYNILKLE